MGVACPPAEDLTWVLGPPSRRSFPKLIGPERDVEEAVRLYREHYEANGLFNGAVYPGMAQALTTLHALPARLFVCTAKPQGFAEKIIAHFGLAHLFDGIYGVDLEGRLDDKGLLIEHIIGVEQIDPARTIMVGDRANDMLRCLPPWHSSCRCHLGLWRCRRTQVVWRNGPVPVTQRPRGDGAKPT
jgi:phosphoglycolate phosphatase